MNNKNAFERWCLMDRRIRKKELEKPSLCDLRNYIYQWTGNYVSKSIIQKDIQLLRNRYDVPIVAFTKRSKFYYKYSDPDFIFHPIDLYQAYKKLKNKKDK